MTRSVPLRALTGVVAAVLVVLALVSSGTASNTMTAAAVPVPTCAKPSSNPTHQRQVDYAECLQKRTEALLANGFAPPPTTTVTVTETVTATPTTPPTTEPTPTDPPTTDPPAPTGFPNDATTGVPASVTLDEYTGPCIFRESHGSSVVIDGKDVRAKCGEILAYHSFDFTIRNSRVPRIEVTVPGSSLTITDSDVRAPDGWPGGALWGSNITATRVDITGGQHSVHCGDKCTIVDSWLHDQYNPDGQSSHNNAFLSNGGKDYVIRGNTLHCTALLNATDGGCTSDLSLIGDWAPIANVLVERNLFKANNSSAAYCTNAGHNPGKPFPTTSDVRYIDNVFERGANGKCGVYGPVTSFNGSSPGNAWTGNTWDSGEPLVP